MVKYSLRFFWLIVLLIVLLNVAYILINPPKLSSPETFSNNYLSNKEIIGNLSKNYSKLFILEIIGLLVFLALIAGFILDTRFIIQILKTKTLGLSKSFYPNINFKDFLKVLILIIFFYSAIKFLAGGLLKNFSQDKLFLTIILNAFFEVFSILVIFSLLGKENLGFKIKPVNKVALSGIKTYVAVLPLLASALILTIFIFKLVKLKPQPMPVVNFVLKERNIANVILLFLEAVLLAPLFEELFFRGILYRLLRKRFSFSFSSVVTGSFFSLLHNNAFSFLPIVVLGICLAYIYERTKNILAPIFLHSLHNFLIFLIILLVRSI